MAKASKNVVALAGGEGGAKLASGLAQLVPPDKLTIVVNTAGDFKHLGLYISADLDTIIYILAGVANPATGRGIKDDSWNMMAAMARYGGPTWIQLGDRELATHLLRSNWLREGYPYTWVTKELCRRLGVRCTVLPMTEQPVRTILQTNEGELALQEYLGKEQGKTEVKNIHYEGIDEAQSSQEVINAIRNADVIVFCPGNPLLSLDPILALPHMRRIIAASPAPKIGVSPIKGEVLNSLAAKLMNAVGVDVLALGVANHLKDVLTGFVIDHLDETHEKAIIELGLRTLVTATIMNNNEARVRLATEVLKFAGAIAH